jgi:NAD(P)-dependent dehydrogenase (short-subunit alcohol dehydrogenase family)
MAERLTGKKAIVTGGGRGIGRAIAQAFADEGAEVLVVGRGIEDLQQSVSLIEATGGTAAAAACDVRDDAAIEACVAAAHDRWGRIDVLVNNAGIDDDTPFLDVDRGRWRDIIATNLTAAFVFSQVVGRHMRDDGTGGVLLHTASIDASAADGPFIAYNSSKAGMLGLNRTLAVELAEYNIRSNCVSPGFTHTDMTEKAVGPALMGYLNGSFDRVPIRRLVRTQEVAAAFVFLASDEASAITGIDLRVDGGLTANLFILETLPDLG